MNSVFNRLSLSISLLGTLLCCCYSPLTLALDCATITIDNGALKNDNGPTEGILLISNNGVNITKSSANQSTYRLEPGWHTLGAKHPDDATVTTFKIHVSANRNIHLGFYPQHAVAILVDEPTVCKFDQTEPGLLAAKPTSEHNDLAATEPLPASLEYQLQQLMTQIDQLDQHTAEFKTNVLPANRLGQFGAVLDNQQSHQDNVLLVLAVSPYSAAHKLGLTSADAIITLGQTSVALPANQTANQYLNAYLGGITSDQMISLTIRRGSQTLTLTDRFKPLNVPEVSYQLGQFGSAPTNTNHKSKTEPSSVTQCALISTQKVPLNRDKRQLVLTSHNGESLFSEGTIPDKLVLAPGVHQFTAYAGRASTGSMLNDGSDFHSRPSEAFNFTFTIKAGMFYNVIAQRIYPQSTNPRKKYLPVILSSHELACEPSSSVKIYQPLPQTPNFIASTPLPSTLAAEFDQLLIQINAFYREQDPQLTSVTLSQSTQSDPVFGLTGRPVNSANSHGLKISAINPYSSAQMFGLEIGDLLTQINEEPLVDDNLNRLSDTIAQIQIGETLTFKLIRAGKPMTLSLPYQPKQLSAYVVTIDLGNSFN